MYSLKGSCKELYLNYFKKLFILATIFGMGVICLADYMLEIFYDDEWIETASILKIYSIMMFGQICSSPLSYTIVFKNYHKYDLGLQLLRFIMVLLSLILIWDRGHFLLGLSVYSTSYLLYYMGHSYLQYRASIG